MLRILSWSSGLGCDTVHTPDFNMFVSKESAAPVSNVAMCSAVKRKRSPSMDVLTNLPLAKTARGQTPSLANSHCSHTNVKSDDHKCFVPPATNHPTRHIASETMSSTPAGPSTSFRSSAPRMDEMRQTISSQLSLDILLKHKELRLIEQEMAKCQIALEQLRRCTEIPFPSMHSPSQLVSEGQGSSARRPGERYPPTSPAPWGVTDGPYARHYAQWLLPDRRFDGGEPELDVSPVAAHTPASSRSTRGHYVDVLAGKTYKPRARNNANLQALPAGYGQPKEKATGPMILKRKSDGTMVKLVCPDCSRHDFGSAQGFINHCRIGHGRSFASHDAAAEACGEPIEYNENGTVRGVEPTASTTPTAINVHPLVRSAKLLPQTPTIDAHLRNGYFPSVSTPTQLERKPASPDFQASQQTPHLSALIKDHGLGLDLQHLVTDAKTKVELLESDGEDDESEIASPLVLAGGRHPQVAGSKQPVKSSMTQPTSSILSSAIRPQPHSQGVSSLVSRRPSGAFARDSFSGPLPSPTNESTQAPSLVDDDEDFDPQSPVSSGEIDEADVHFEVHDDEHGDRVARFREIAAPPTACSPNPAGRVPPSAVTADVQTPDKHVN